MLRKGAPDLRVVLLLSEVMVAYRGTRTCEGFGRLPERVPKLTWLDDKGFRSRAFGVESENTIAREQLNARICNTDMQHTAACEKKQVAHSAAKFLHSHLSFWGVLAGPISIYE